MVQHFVTATYNKVYSGECELAWKAIIIIENIKEIRCTFSKSSISVAEMLPYIASLTKITYVLCTSCISKAGHIRIVILQQVNIIYMYL